MTKPKGRKRAMSDKDRGVYVPGRDRRPGFGAAAPEPEETGNKGPLILAVGFGVVVAVCGVIWSSYQQGVRSGGRDAPPRIAAEDRPFKTRPADPGGKTVADLDKEVYEALTRAAAPLEAEGPRTLAEPEEGGGETAAAASAPEDAPPAFAIEMEPDADAFAGFELEITPRLKPAEPGGAPTAAPAALEEAKPAPPPLSDDGFEYVVQLASFRTPDKADAGWKNAKARHGDLLEGFQADVARADLGDKGVHYRLRVAGFAGRAQAAGFCDTLQRRGQDCLVVRR